MAAAAARPAESKVMDDEEKAEYERWQDELAARRDFKQLTKSRLQAAFESSFSRKQVEKGATFVLIVDRITFEIVSSTLKSLELMQMGCAVVETIETEDKTNTRVPQPSLDAIYFVSPTKDTLKRISQDFSVITERVTGCFAGCCGIPKVIRVESDMYNSASVFFTRSPDPALLKSFVRGELGQSSTSNSRIGEKLKALQVLHLEYMCAEPRIFSFGMKDDLQQLFFNQSESRKSSSKSKRRSRKKPRPDLQTVVDDMARKLVSVCVTLDEMPPHVRYSSTSKVAPMVVKSFWKHMNEFLEKEGFNAETNPHGMRPSRGWNAPAEAGTLIVVDRPEDLAATLLHEFTYQSMIQDLLDVQKGDQIKTSDPGSKDVWARLDQEDMMYMRMRNLDYQGFCVDFNKTVKRYSKKARADDDKEPSLEEVALKIKNMSSTIKATREINTHLSIIKRLQKMIEQRNLSDLVTEEQNVATGVDADGFKFSYHKHKDEIQALLKSNNLSLLERTRLVALIYLSVSDSHKHLRSMANTIGLAPDKPLMLGLRNLKELAGPFMPCNLASEAELDPSGSKDVKVTFVSKPRFAKLQDGAKQFRNSRYPTRYRTRLKEVVQAHIREELPTDRFPYSTFPAAPSDEDDLKLYRTRVIVFVVGGMSYSEVRAVNKIVEDQLAEVQKAIEQEKRFVHDGATRTTSATPSVHEVIAGSSSIVTPNEFYAKLCVIGTKTRESDYDDILSSLVERYNAHPNEGGDGDE